jgi:hypothetical protein
MGINSKTAVSTALASSANCSGCIDTVRKRHWRTLFAQSVGWPLALIVFGMFMIGLSALAFRIDRDYVRVLKAG